MTWQKNLMNCQAVQIFGHNLVIDQAVELVYHKAKSLEFIPCILKMHTDILAKKYFSSLFISVYVAYSQQQSKIFAEIL